MLWLLLFSSLAYAQGDIITFENLKLRLVGGLQSCPDVKDLQRNNNMYWSAPGGWRSYNASFSKSLNNLVGVQWQGDKVGNIFCQYKDLSKLTFPVLLQAPGLYLRPDNWKHSAKATMTCMESELGNCQFQKVEEVIQDYNSNKSLLEMLEGIKKGRDDG